MIILKNKSLKTIMAAFIAMMVFLMNHTYPVAAQSQIGVYDLINLINGWRSSYGLGALSTDASLMACAQSTAETMAAYNMMGHIGNVSGRASSFGYNNYNTCFATENFMVGNATTTISQLESVWGDSTHQILASSSKYCHIGAGVAQAADGSVYYVVQGAYPGTGGCGYASSTGSYAASASTGSDGASLFIQSVQTATPDESGLIFHTVQDGQTLWSIAEAYGTTVQDIQSWNGLNNSTALSLGQQLRIPSASEIGQTPTLQVALTIYPTADANGKFHHHVTEGDTLWSISDLWHVSLNDIYQANGMNAESSIGLGWDILIPVTATNTPLPSETPTMTPEPSETPVPTDTLAPEVGQEGTSESPAPGSASHLPKASARTYLFLGIGLLILLSGVFLLIGFYFRKK